MLPKALLPFFFSFVLSGGLIAFPGTVLNTLLDSFGFTPTLFGLALFVQGTFALLGTRFFSNASLRAGASLHALEGLALLLPLAGIGVVYLSDPLLELLSLPALPPAARLLGYAALGAGIGGSGILNNAFALRRGDTTRSLGFLNMAFTAGAVALPAATSALLSQDHLFSSLAFAKEHAWRTPMVFLFCAYLTLSVWCLRHAKRHVDTQSSFFDVQNTGKEKKPPFVPFFPLFAACLLMFCYVGAEVGMAITWVPFLLKEVGLTETTARLASPLYWGGLFFARLTFSLVPPPTRLLPRFLAVFGMGVLVCLGLALAASSKTALFIPLFTPQDSSLWLAVAGFSGAFIGASYSFVLALLTAFYASIQASRAAFAAAQFGVAGAVLVPPALGATIDATSFSGGLVFVFLTMVPFTLMSIALAQHTRRTLP